MNCRTLAYMGVSLSLAACGSSGKVQVMLTDAPLDGATAVNVTLTKVEVHHVGDGGEDDDSGWQTILEEEKSFNLLELQDGVTAPLGDAELPEGKITQVRLVVTDDASLVNDTGTYPLEISSGTETGIKLVGCFNVVADEETTITVDFDAGASVSGDLGSGYKLRPTIKLTTEGDCKGGGDDDEE